MSKLTQLEAGAIGRLNKATDWVIRYGAFVKFQKGDDFLISKMYEVGPVQMWYHPVVEEHGKLALFQLKAGGYRYQIEAIFRKEMAGTVYEYWATHVISEGEATPLRKCMFHVTALRARDGVLDVESGKRDILEKSTSFISGYRTPKGEIFGIAEGDLKALYLLRAWDYPDCFAGSDLPEKRVRQTEGGGYLVDRAPVH